MVTVQLTSKTGNIDRVAVRALVEKLLAIEQYAGYDLGVKFVSERTIQGYNKAFRNVDKATDVLSFPYHEHLKPGARVSVMIEEDTNLGDIVIAPGYVQRWCDEHEYDFDARIKELLVHGFCHLLGYDHITDADFEIMQEHELVLFKKLDS